MIAVAVVAVTFTGSSFWEVPSSITDSHVASHAAR
jgi:hypothetical protein